MTAFYVYVAGPLSDMPAQYLANVAAMSQVSRELTGAGYVTINPAADMLEGLMSPTPWPLSLFQSRSLAIMRLLANVPGAVYVTAARHADGRESGGVMVEIEEARRLRIPVAFSRLELDHLRDTHA